MHFNCLGRIYVGGGGGFGRFCHISLFCWFRRWFGASFVFCGLVYGCDDLLSYFPAQGVLLFLLAFKESEIVPGHGASVIKCPVPPVMVTTIIAVPALIVVFLFPDGAFIVLVVVATVWADNYAGGAGSRCMTVFLTASTADGFIFCYHDDQTFPLIYTCGRDHTEGQCFSIESD